MTRKPKRKSPAPVARAARLTIDLGAIAENWKRLDRKSGKAETGAAVKADAYGLGARQVVPALLKAGCRTFFVATPAEGAEVRKLAPKSDIVVLNGFDPALGNLFKSKKLTPVLNSLADMVAWTDGGQPGAGCAIHIDTGMNRLGLSPAELKVFLGNLPLVSALKPTIVMTHPACADDPGHPMNARQLAAFEEAASHFPYARKSMANSATILSNRKACFDLTRPGIALYGGAAVSGVKNPMKPVVKLELPILQVRHARKGETVGYGATHRLKRDTLIVTAGAGYADGILRSASGSGVAMRQNTRKTKGVPGASAMIGKYALPILGRVSMDSITLDASGVPAATLKRASHVEILNRHLTIDDLAIAAGTIGYEVLTSLGLRYERIYLNE
ncbi:MAG: alanine racemase [Nitratireductor sp.]|nr:alanine racemase [Nitratireductor sp.]